jgi:hypothetical protein
MDAKDIEQLLGLRRGAFDHIPEYCRNEAMQAMASVLKMEEKRVFRSGLYHIVFSDLCNATEASVKLGLDLNKQRVESFITVCVGSLAVLRPVNYAQVIKPVGDAVLLIFSMFAGVYNWWSRTQGQMQFFSSDNGG